MPGEAGELECEGATGAELEAGMIEAEGRD